MIKSYYLLIMSFCIGIQPLLAGDNLQSKLNCTQPESAGSWKIAWKDVRGFAYQGSVKISGTSAQMEIKFERLTGTVLQDATARVQGQSLAIVDTKISGFSGMDSTEYYPDTFRLTWSCNYWTGTWQDGHNQSTGNVVLTR